jgi:hypothetical protein
VGGVDVSEELCNRASDLKIMGARVTLTLFFEVRPPSENAKEPKKHKPIISTTLKERHT